MALRPNWYDDGGSSRSYWIRSPAAWSGMRWIFTLTIGVFLLQLMEVNLLRTSYLTEYGALRAWLPPSASDLAAGLDHGAFNFFFPLQLFTYPLLHAGWGHIFGNLLFLFFFGPEVEATFGRAGFLRLYIGGAIAGGLMQWGWYLVQGDFGSVIGASGAIFAVMVLFALRWPHRTILIWFVLPVPVWAFVGAYMLINVAGLLGPAGVTSVLAHLGGAAYGLLWHRSGDMLERVSRARRRARVERVLAETDADRREMDRILGKIQASGLGSLDSRERGFLERRSRELREQGR